MKKWCQVVITVYCLGVIAKAVKIGVYAEERPESETGLGKTQVGLLRKKLQTNQMEMKQAGVARIR